MSTQVCLTVYFDGQYWIGLLEWTDDEGLRVARHIFGAEPSDPEIMHCINYELAGLRERATAVLPDQQAVPRIANPKRAAREAAKLMKQPAVSTKAHEALRLQLETNKQASRTQSKLQRELKEAYKREVARRKARLRHRGH